MSEYPIIEDFEVRLKPAITPLGMHLSLTRQSAPPVGEELAGFPWCDDADATIRVWKDADIPGAAGEFSDGEQGWAISIWADGDFIYVLEGDDWGSERYNAGFRVPRARYFASWQKAIEKARLVGTVFNSVDEALRFPKMAKKLNLYFARLGGTLPPGIGSLTLLEDIDLTYNQLSELPSFLGALRALRVVTLSKNLLMDVPGVLRNLQLLEELSLHENRITVIPGWLAELPHLRILDLRDNPVTEVPAALKARPGLEVMLGSVGDDNLKKYGLE